MRNIKKVSIIIPVFNIEQYIGRCLESILCQTYSNIEIIIIDDGSVDDSGAICDEYMLKDDRIKVIHKDNGGLSSARNAGIDIAIGEYLVFVDGDDWIDKRYVEILVWAIEDTDASIACCGSSRVYEENNFFKDSAVDIKVYSSESAIENMCYLREINCAAWGKIFIIDLFRDIRFPVGKIYEDMAIVYKLFDRAQKIVYVEYMGYFYYHRNGSILHSGFVEDKLERIYIADDILSFLKQKYPEIINSGYCRCLVSYLGAYMDLPFARRDVSIWTRVKKVRRYVLRDTKCERNIRILALVSYSGKLITKAFLKAYSSIRQRHR